MEVVFHKEDHNKGHSEGAGDKPIHGFPSPERSPQDKRKHKEEGEGESERARIHGVP